MVLDLRTCGASIVYGSSLHRMGTFRLALVTSDSRYSLLGVRSLNRVVAEFVGLLILSFPHLEPSSSVRFDCSPSASGTSPVRTPEEPP
jgi:hypothetical protein